MSNRGRGQRRGGRGAGRGRNRHRGNAGRAPTSSSPECAKNSEWELDLQSDSETTSVYYDLENVADVRLLFSANASFQQHLNAQESDRVRYLAVLQILDKNGVDIAQSARVRALAAAWARCDSDAVGKLLATKSLYGLPEVLKAVMLLDAGRRCRQLERKLEVWQSPKMKVKTKKLGKLKSEIDNLKAISVSKGSLTKRVCRQVATWARDQSQEDLEYFALHFPKEPWKTLADLCHFHPQKDFPASSWFLPYCFGSPAPDGGMVQICGSLSGTNANEIIKEFDVPYSHIRQHANHKDLTDISKAKIASYTSLDQILWYYEELCCPSVDEQILKRLNHGHEITLPLGKLLERLLAIKLHREGIGATNEEYEWDERTETLSLKKRNRKAAQDPVYLKIAGICQERLKNIVVPIEGPVAVLGDKSGSMDIAIRCSTLLACILSAITSATLVFFNNQAEEVATDANDILQVLELAVSICADKSTAPAAGLWHFYEKKQVIKTFIVATDEEENTKSHGYLFHELYKKYCAEVYPAKLLFVSFLRNQHDAGQMVQKLQKEDINPLQFKFNLSRPDLTKFEKLLGFLSTESEAFKKQLEDAVAAMRIEDDSASQTGAENNASDPQAMDMGLAAAPQSAPSTSAQSGDDWVVV